MQVYYYSSLKYICMYISTAETSTIIMCTCIYIYLTLMLTFVFYELNTEHVHFFVLLLIMGEMRCMF